MKIRVMPRFVKSALYKTADYHTVGKDIINIILDKASDMGYEVVEEINRNHEDSSSTYTVCLEKEEGDIRFRGYAHFNIPNAHYASHNDEWFWYFA